MEEKPNNKSTVIIVLVLVVVALGFGYYYFKNLNKVSATKKSDVALTPPVAQNDTMGESPAELKIEDLVVGTEAEAKKGSIVTVHYLGTLLNGTKFQDSKDFGTPFTFNLGSGEVIPGWDQGVPGMKVGGKRKLTIPASLAYGAAGSPPVIGPNEALVFEIELLEVK